ncbi:UNKNOWN [Stylonychia lemnae]|uniref:DBF4-type domain-containing protein n=1 Tax=Stylonychia lemnae TaxID=5949 RepID=A0A077ZQZ8_STYLE|nr:UNKNOWN [Stylonychia lemnae]|eukprot:CDW71874.1 UNKNOWN [Stylonychia lemnae]
MKLKPFQMHFTNYNSIQNSNKGYAPQLLIVADEIFDMSNKQLSQQVRQSIPNTYKESNLISCRNSSRSMSHQQQMNQQYHGLRHQIESKISDNGKRYIGKKECQENLMEVIERQEKFRQKDQWNQTAYVVQAHVFNDQIERQNQSVYEYLIKDQHDIISFSYCAKITEYWLSQRVEFHIEKGLKLNSDGTACLSGRPISYQNVTGLNTSMKKQFIKEAKQAVFCITATNPGSLTASQQSGGMNQKSSQHAQEYHYFMSNQPTQMVTLRTFFANQIYIGKYDYPHFNPNAPLGTSLFPLVNERQYAQENYQHFMEKHQKDIELQKQKKTKEEKEQPIEEPRPGANHLFCAVCKEGFKDYYQHIFSSNHRQNGRNGQNLQIYQEIDKTIIEVEQIQTEKEKEREKIMRKSKLDILLLNSKDINNPEDKQKGGLMECVINNDLSSGESKLTSATDSDLVSSLQANLNNQSQRISAETNNNLSKDLTAGANSIQDELKERLIIDIDDDDENFIFQDQLAEINNPPIQPPDANDIIGQRRVFCDRDNNRNMNSLVSINQVDISSINLKKREIKLLEKECTAKGQSNQLTSAAVQELRNSTSSVQEIDDPGLIGQLSQTGSGTKRRRK